MQFGPPKQNLIGVRLMVVKCVFVKLFYFSADFSGPKKKQRKVVHASWWSRLSRDTLKKYFFQNFTYPYFGPKKVFFLKKTEEKVESSRKKNFTPNIQFNQTKKKVSGLRNERFPTGQGSQSRTFFAKMVLFSEIFFFRKKLVFFCDFQNLKIILGYTRGQGPNVVKF